jgi:hypothetical protein
MGPVYSKRFLSASAASTGQVAVVPGGKVWVIKTARVINHSGAGGTGAGIAGAHGEVLCASAYPVNGEPLVAAFDGMYVLNAGESLTLAVSGGSWDAHCSGYELTEE